MSAAILKRLKSQRSAVRGSAARNIQRSKDMLGQTGDEAASIDNLTEIRKKLQSYRDEQCEYDAQIFELTTEEGDFDAEVQHAFDLKEELEDVIRALDTRLKKLQIAAPVGSGESDYTGEHSHAGSQGELFARLPKLTIAKFHGDPLRWREFWDSFDAAVHSKASLSPVTKFQYLTSFLEGDAKRAIEGIAVTNATYETAIETIKERFGNEEVVIFSHLYKLFDLPTSADTTAELRGTFDECEKHLRSLEALGLGETTYGRVFAPMILCKLPRNLRVELHRKNGSQKWELATMRKLLREEVQARELGDRTFGESERVHRGPNINAQRGIHRHTTDALLTPSTRNAKHCVFCNGGHYSDKCSVCKDTASRLSRLKNTCFKCLKPGHYTKECTVKLQPCRYCHRNGHNSALCEHTFGVSKSWNKQKTTTMNTNLEDKSEDYAYLSTHSSSGESVQVNSMMASGQQSILQTAKTSLISPENKGNSVNVRILLDSGSQHSYITQDVMKLLKLKPKEYEHVSIAHFGSTEQKSVTVPLVEVQIAQQNKELKTVSVIVIPVISRSIRKVPINKNKHTVLRELRLSEPLLNVCEDIHIDVLIGNDYYYELVGREIVDLSPGLVLVQSTLGWIVSGRVTPEKPSDKQTSLVSSAISTFMANVDLEKIWSLESIGIKDPPYVSDDDKAVESFNKNVKFEDKRYHIIWPWKNEAKEIPDNYKLAYGRLKSLIKRLSDQPDIMQKYDATIQEQLKLGIIEKVDETVVEGPVKHYIAHHCVIKPDKATTKLRVVYDGSAKQSKDSKSLNESLYRGPVLLENLCGLLLRFRLPNIAMISDIEKAFLQIGIQDQERDVTRFLWIRDPTKYEIDGNLETYRFCRVPFGVISSPFLLGAVINHHLKLANTEVAQKILQGIYVDNVLAGAESLKEATTFYKEAKQLFADASMDLREWSSNSKEFMDSVPEKDRGKGEVFSVLGVQWDTTADTLRLKNPNLQTKKKYTKREVVQMASSIFDPLGFFTPVTLAAKLFVQSLWHEDVQWDELIPEDLATKWSALVSDLNGVASVAFSRCIYGTFYSERTLCRRQDQSCGSSETTVQEDVSENAMCCREDHGHQISDPSEKIDNPDSSQCLKQTCTSLSLHCFTDASAKAYSTCLYLVATTPTDTTTKLVFSKTRLAPTKSITLPRLELMGVLIGVRAMKFVSNELKLHLEHKFLWSDSKCVLHWISNQRLRSVFVENRLKEIRSHKDILFRYVPTADNPADLPTRGLTCDQILESSFWWSGPEWLRKAEESWPKKMVLSKTETEEFNDKKQAEFFSHAIIAPVEPNNISPFGIDETRFSSLKTLLRVTVWCQRFVSKLKREQTEVFITAEEMNEANQKWCKHVQKVKFCQQFESIRLSKKDSLMHQLDLYDDQGTLRCGGRLSNTVLPQETKHPTLLPKDCYFTDLVIKDCHERLLHAGCRHVLTTLRQKFWIPQGRAVVRKVIRRCTVCRNWDAGPYTTPSVPDLPSFRVEEAKAFEYTGLDYMGPLYIKGEDSPKTWICLYTCAVTRAIHLEVVTDLSTEHFLMSFRRFIARRGVPNLVVSDNAKHFKLSARTIDKLWSDIMKSEDVYDYCSTQGIRWKFITEISPRMGGFYERLVGSVKRALRRTIGKRCLTLVQLQTLSTEIESVLNTRPLLYVESEYVDHNCLTPAHFLSINPKHGFPSVIEEDEFKQMVESSDALQRSWKHGQHCLNEFWQIWLHDYLTNLRERNFRWKQSRNASDAVPTAGDVVIIRDTNVGRGQ